MRLGLKSEACPTSETAGLSDKGDNEQKTLVSIRMAVKKCVRLRYLGWGCKKNPMISEFPIHPIQI